MEPGEAVALQIEDPAVFVALLVALDGVAGAILAVARDLPMELVERLMGESGSGLLLSQRHGEAIRSQRIPSVGNHAERMGRDPAATAYLMTTSGTTGLPKVVEHSLDSLTRSIRTDRPQAAAWGLLYDPSRFAGLQVVLQALLTGGLLIPPDRHWPLQEQLAFLASKGCTHLSATPSLWRKILMHRASQGLPLLQATLGGEIADARLLRAISTRFPEARVTHIYASTETGVGLSVNDRLPGFPASLLHDGMHGSAFRIVDGVLWARPPAPGRPMSEPMEGVDADGYICTNDMVELVGDRVLFRGRGSSVANVGGTKIRLEEVEQVVLEMELVQDCVVRAVANPIMGSVLHLWVVPRRDADPGGVEQAVRQWCKARLQREARPARIALVDDIAIAASGKISRALSA